MITKQCEQCGGEFATYPCEIKKGWGKYCSRACKGKARQVEFKKSRPVVVCQLCGKQFRVTPFQLKQGRGKYCSRECADIGLSKRHKGRAPEEHPCWKGGKEKRACKVCGKEFGAYPDNPQKYCSWDCRGLDQRGIDNKPRERDSRVVRWRKDVFARDNYKCQDCGDKRGGNLNAHHLFLWRDFPEVRYEVWNGITLCEDCHKARHYAAVA